VLDTEGAAGFFLHIRTNDAFRAVNRLLAAGEEVRRLQEPFTVQGHTHPPGMFFVTAKPSTLPRLERIAAELGTRFIGAPSAPRKEAAEIKPVRIGLWDRYGGSMPSGWTRWLLEHFEFPFQVVFPPELDRGGLREKFDVLIFADGAIPAAREGSPTGSAGRGAATGDQPPSEDPNAGGTEQELPTEYRGRRGSITAATTIPRLREFLQAGGTILTVGSSCSLGQHLGLPIANHLVAKDKDGNEQPLPREKFFVPGSVMRVRVDPTNPVAWGLSDAVDVMFSGSPTYRFTTNEGSGDSPASSLLRRVAWYDAKAPLRSGWAWGQEHLDGGVAIAEAQVGSGRLVMFGPQITFRAQPHGTFKFLFNGIVQAGVKSKSSTETTPEPKTVADSPQE
jgi:hypothetical protein